MSLRVPGAMCLLACLGARAVAQDRITVETNAVVHDLRGAGVGLNVNYLLDADRRRPGASRALGAAVGALKPRFLRYPGGEKSDAYLWSTPPFEKPRPTLARTGPMEWPANDPQFTTSSAGAWIPGKEPMDFDEFIALCREVGAEPVVVVAFDSMYKPATPGGTAPQREELLRSAQAWVRYANVTKRYGVKYWEIGNETDYGDSYAGRDPGAAQHATDTLAFATAMKSVDPTIFIGANGRSRARFAAILQKAAASIDYLVVHSYPTYQWTDGYERFRLANPTVPLTSAVDDALTAIDRDAPAAERGKLHVALTEVNANDYGPGWDNVNDLGHALVVFDILGQHLLKPRVRMSLLWNTRWVNNDQVMLPVGETNLVAPDNATFEDGLTGWQVKAGAAATVAVGAEVAGGTKALRLAGDADGYVSRPLPPGRLIAGGRMYTLTAWGRASADGWAAVGIDFLEGGRRIAREEVRIAASPASVKVRTVVRTPAKFEEARLWIGKTAAPSMLTVDDIAIVDGAAPSVMDALNGDNQPWPVARALELWGRFLRSTMVAATGTAAVRAFASRDAGGAALSIFLVNKERAAREVAVTVVGDTPPAPGSRHVLSGSGPADLQPTWRPEGVVALNGRELRLTLPAVSITVIAFGQSAPVDAGPPADATSGPRDAATGAADVPARAESDGGEPAVGAERGMGARPAERPTSDAAVDDAAPVDRSAAGAAGCACDVGATHPSRGSPVLPLLSFIAIAMWRARSRSARICRPGGPDQCAAAGSPGVGRTCRNASTGNARTTASPTD